MPPAWSPVPTPPASLLRDPSEGELATWEKGPNKFPDIGNFKVYKSVPGSDDTPYNCFAWSVGFTDRWLEGGTREQMKALYAHYYYVACTSTEAEVDMYDIPGAPVTLTRTIPERKNKTTGKVTPATSIQYHNLLSNVMHAHRNDDPAKKLSSSKLGNVVVQHGRQALEDTRPYGSSQPPITFGTIYGHFKKHPDHPSNPGKSANKVPAKPPGPMDPRNANPSDPNYPSGNNPMGHPHQGLQPPFTPVPHPPCTLHGAAAQKTGPANNSSAAAAAAKAGAVPPTAGAAPPKKATAAASSSPPASRPSTANSSTNSSSSASSASSSSSYKKAPRMNPFAPVPAPSAAAVKSTKDVCTKLKTTSPTLVKDFDDKYAAWKKTWFSNSNKDSANAATRASGPEFAALVDLGPKILPLVVNQLTSGKDFIAVVLYNKLEKDDLYKLDPQDLLNSKVLQRHANLLVDFNYNPAVSIINMNFDRNIEVKDALDRWAEFRVERQNYSSSGLFCEGEGYWALTTLGSSIIAQVMLEYYDDKHGWWHELLHELVHGRRSGAPVFFKPALFEEWKDWFERKEHKDAPEGEDKRARMGHGPGRDPE